MRATVITLAALFLSAAPSMGEGGKLILTTSDYVSGNTAVYDSGAKTLADNLLGHFQDAYARTHGRDVYLIEGGDNSSIMQMDPGNPGKPLWQYSVGAGSNPHDLVFVPAAEYLKGYVLRYNKASLWVVNLNAAKSTDFKLREIDLSAWKDDDGAPEMHLGYYYGGYVWVVCQRYSLSTFSAGTAVLLKIDPATDTVVDLDPAVPGVQGRDLIRKNPVAGSLAGSTLYLAGTTYGVSDEGVWSVDLADPALAQTVILPESALGGSVAGVYVPNPSQGVVTSYDASWNAVPRAFDPATGTLRDVLPVPDAGGGMVMAEGLLYIGSRHYENPALYVLDPGTNTVTAGPFPTSLPPLTLAWAGDPEPVAVEESGETPAPFALRTAYPNPFNPSTTLSFTLDRGMRITLEAYSATGQKIAALTGGFFPAGSHSVKWGASGLASGVYCIRLSGGGKSAFAKVMLVK